MKKIFKITGAIGAIGATIAPIASVVSCGSSTGDAVIILSGKTQIQKAGEKFANTFDSKPNGKVKGAPSSTHFISANGDSILQQLATKFGSKQFPSVMNLAQASMVNQYVEKNAILKFKDPKYDHTGTPADKSAEATNISIAGEKINELIKAAEVNDLPVMKSGNDIVGLPSFSEAIGIVYNKAVFAKGGIKNVKVGAAADKSIIASDGTVTIDSTHDTLYTDTLTKSGWNNLKTQINSNKVKFGVKGAQGIVVSGKESWAFTSKIGTSTVIAKAAGEANLTIGNVQMPGDTVADGTLTPTKAREKLFVGSTGTTKQDAISTLKGNTVYKDAAEMYLKNTKSYSTNNDMMDQLLAGNIAMMPQGTWEEGYLSKGDNIKNMGFLPLSMGSLSGSIKPYYSADIVGYWQFANQKVATGRSGASAVAVQTKAANFLYDLYLEDYGSEVLTKDMGLLDPLKPSVSPDPATHPLLAATATAKKLGERTIRWGVAYNLPGAGASGFERNNISYTEKVKAYQENSSDANLTALQNKVYDIWKN